MRARHRADPGAKTGARAGLAAILARGLGALAASLLAGAAIAAAPVQFTPSGEVEAAREVRAVFGEPMVRLGDARPADPYEVDCPVAGRGRWIDPGTWIWRSEAPMPAGIRCTFTPRAGVRALSGGAPAGFTRQTFSTPGPAVVRSQPWEDSRIAEDQVFLLALSGPAQADSVAQRAWCRVEGIGERVAVRLLPAAEQRELARRLEPGESHVLALACARTLPPGARVALVWDSGIASPSGVTSRRTQTLEFRVRDVFTATLSCTREQPAAPCSPLADLRLEFSAPVPRDRALAARLRLGSTERVPVAEGGRDAPQVEAVVFRGPLPESAAFVLTLPADLRDAEQRRLANAGEFPLAGRTGAFPPLAKFAAAPFGIIELDQAPAMPLALRRVERELLAAGGAGAGRGSVRSLRLTEDAAIIAWYAKVQRLHERALLPDDLRQALGEPARPAATPGRRSGARTEPPPIETRSVGLLAREPAARRLELPPPAGEGEWPFELIGVPLPEPGLHVLEIESPRLGRALLARDASMYVRTAALVTNLAVHYKQGADNALVWVTSLDRGRPVAGAEIRISDCDGRPLWQGRTDAQGIARVLPAPPAAAPTCGEERPGHFVSARSRDAQGRDDVSFAWSGWTQGIETWRFELPTRWERGGPTIAHTVFDRMLLRAGDTVSMKHFLRAAGSQGLARPPAGARLPDTLRIVHEASGQSWRQPLSWQAGSAVSSFRLPAGARLGRYEVHLETAEGPQGAPAPLWPGNAPSGSFRVEAFRQPVFDARLGLPAALAAGAREAAADLRIGWYSGGPAARLPVRVSARLNPHLPSFPGWEGYRFDRADLLEAEGAPEGEAEAASRARAADRGIHRERLVLDKQAVELDAQGTARVRVAGLPPMAVPHRLDLEATFADPSGEIQSIARGTVAWPSQVVVGLRTEGWAVAGGKVGLQVAVLDTAGRPLKERAVRVTGRLERTISHRKRLIGGLYAYENQRVSRDLGELCRARTAASGVATCAIAPRLPEGETGQLVLLASADDDAGRSAGASASVWIADRGELWFDAQAQDRIDLIPHKRKLVAGETARLQVRMPFRRATALVTVEREGILEARVVELRGSNPTVELPTRPEWGPNVFVSVMPVRGRLREVPWYSLFTWGWRTPLDWWREYDGRGELPAARLAPTATVDLARPAFRLGIAELALGAEGARLAVKVTPEREQVRVREQVPVAIDVRLPDGRTPAAGAQVAVAAVDEALLELLPNTSWQLLEAMMQRRSLDVETASGQMHVVGKRHFGRKAVAAGGDGGRHPTRELFDTLLYWNPSVTLDARGQARVTVPVNDALTRFRIVAIADAGEGHFGTGEATIRSHQPLQLASGLPQAVRAGDTLAGELTVRNNANQVMTVTLSARARAEGADGVEQAGAPALEVSRTLTLAAGASQAVALPLRVPDAATGLRWQIEASEAGGQRDALRLRQAVVPAVPLTVRQATLIPVEGEAGVSIAAPAGALTGRSQVRVALAGGLAASSLAGARDWLLRYPYGCLEQRASRAVGLADAALWQALLDELPAYLDRDGLAQFFPVRDGLDPAGSETLTAWLLMTAREAGLPMPAALRDTLLGGLAAWVEGRARREGWALRADRSERRLAAMAALAAHGRLPLAQAATLDPAVERLPVSALLDWITVLEAVAALPRRDGLLGQADALLRARLLASGTQLGLAERDDEPWWLLSNGETAHARLLLHAARRESWRADAPRLATGLAARQRQGAWSTTTANAWGSIAMRAFAARFEATPVAGRTRASLGEARRELDWKERSPAPFDLPLPAGDARLRLTHEGAGRPWAQVQVLAAVPLAQPVARGYQITRTLEAVERREPGAWHRGDLVRVRITLQADSAMPWVVLADPLPPGATVLGSGLGRETTLAPSERPDEGGRGERWPAPAYIERHPTAVHAYWERLPGGRRVFEYLMRLNQPGEFRLPPTRVEAMYQPDVHGESPNPGLAVRP